MEQQGRGLVLRGEDGSLYFIREEVLEGCRTDGEDLAYVQRSLGEEAEVEGFSMEMKPLTFEPLGMLGSPNAGKAEWNPPRSAMCPW